MQSCNCIINQIRPRL